MNNPNTADDSGESTKEYLNNTLEGTDFAWLGKKYKGKVRDVYQGQEKLALIASDRQSAFDISWCSIPLKGQVLTQISLWWFEQTKQVMPNHIIAAPDPNVLLVKKLQMFPVEVVVRAYLAGSTETSAWVNYSRGVRNFCGNELPDGLAKNQALPEIIITPTTKGTVDEPIDAAAVLARGLATKEEWQVISESALRLFKRGQEIAREKGLILVDTKYEIGRDADGVITVGDEVHTPDSSRFWLADSYEERFAAGLEPESLDKEFFRTWLISEGYRPEERETSPRPEITDEVRVLLAEKYIDLYQRITGQEFVYPENIPILDRIEQNLRASTLG